MSRLGTALALLALLATACAPAVPEIPNGGPLSSAPAPSTVPEGTAGSTAAPRAGAAPVTSAPPTTAATTTTATTATTTTTTSTTAPPAGLTAGAWTVGSEERDESGAQFSALIVAPVVEGDVAPALQGKVTTAVDGHVESLVGGTLALWRSLEAQGARDMSGSTLDVEFDIAGFTPGLLSLRFFVDEQVGESGGAKRDVSVLMIDLEAGVVIGLDDVVLGAAARASLLALVRDALRDEYFGGDEETFTLWAGDLVEEHLERAALTPEGLEIWFDELEVGPPEFGRPVVAIPYEALGAIVDPSGPAANFLP